MTEMQKAAMEYVQRGYAIFPIKYKGKTPLTKNGVKNASNDPTQVQEWWDKWPDANIGLATGQINNIVVIDLDVDEDSGVNGFDSIRDWQRDNGELPKTWTSKTGRNGQHIIYRTAEKFKNRVGILPCVDVRADGGYIVAPPSTHPNGNKYEWLCSPDDCEISPINEIIRKFLDTGNNQLVQSTALEIPDKVGKGKRNDTMFKIACSLQSKGLTDDAIFSACSAENSARFSPPLDEKELRTIIASVTGRFLKGAPIFFDSAGKAVQGQREPHLERNDKGKPLNIIANLSEAIEFDAMLYGKIKYNTIAYSPFVIGALPWDSNPNNFREWTNFDDSALKSYIEQKYGLSVQKNFNDAFNNVVGNKRFNPVEDMLVDIWQNRWDKKTGHIRKLLPDYLGAPDDDYTYEVIKIFMLGAISRGINPGCKFDYMPVFVGPQGVGKSTFLRYLSLNNAWYNDNFNTIEGDKATEKLRGMWMVELAELLATKKAKEVESIKAFITSTCDSYRTPYDRRTEQRPRACVFAGTTNSQLFLVDRTGNRRFLPVTVGGARKKSLFTNDVSIIADFENAWGEAMQIYMDANGKPSLKLPEYISDAVQAMQEKHTEEDPRVGIIQNWLDNRDLGEKVCAVQIWKEALENEFKPYTRKDITEIHQILQQTDWVKGDQKARVGKYGVQSYYSKPCNLLETADFLPF